MSEWQPIETWPGYAIDVIGFFPDFSDDYKIMIVHSIEGDWYHQGVDLLGMPLESNPTHWMHIPTYPPGVSK